jgi:hypothetical protein
MAMLNNQMVYIYIGVSCVTNHGTEMNLFQNKGLHPWCCDELSVHFCTPYLLWTTAMSVGQTIYSICWCLVRVLDYSTIGLSVYIYDYIHTHNMSMYIYIYHIELVLKFTCKQWKRSLQVDHGEREHIHIHIYIHIHALYIYCVIYIIDIQWLIGWHSHLWLLKRPFKVATNPNGESSRTRDTYPIEVTFR